MWNALSLLLYEYFRSGSELDIQQFHWFLRDLELSVSDPESGNFRSKIKINHLWDKMANNFSTTL